MKPFFDYMQTSLGLEPLQALFGAVITSAILAFFLRHLWKNYDDARALYLSTQPLVDDELRLMQERHDTIEDEARIYNQTTANEIYNALAPEERLRHDKGYELHQRIEHFKENAYWETYQSFVQRALGGVRRITGEARDGVPETQLFSFQSYLLLLFLAIFYPVLFAVGNSVVSESLSLAGIELIKFKSLGHACLYLGLLITNGAISFVGGKLSVKSDYWFWGSLILILGISQTIIAPIFNDIAYIFATIVGFVILGYFTNFFASVTPIGGAVAVGFVGIAAMSMTTSGVFSFIATYPIAFAMFYILTKSLSSQVLRQKTLKAVVLAVSVISALLFAYFAAAIFTINKYAGADKQYLVLMPVFMGLLPLFNALLDWISLNITRLLTHKILADNHSLMRTIGFALLDLGLALAFVVVVSSVTLAGLASLGWIFDSPIVDLSNLMTGLGDPERLSEHHWVHAMVLSTLIPTLFHLGLVLYSFAMYWMTHWRREHIDNFFEPGVDRGKVFEYVLMRKAMVVVTVAVMGLGIWHSFGYLGAAGCWLWHWADGLLLIADPFYQTPGSVCLTPSGESV